MASSQHNNRTEQEVEVIPMVDDPAAGGNAENVQPRKRKPVPARPPNDGCFGKFMDKLADMILPTEEDKIEYLKNYNCMPPPVFILVVSITELVVFIYFSVVVETKQWMTLDEALLDNVLVYDPYMRQQVWRFLSYMLVHAGIEHIMGNVLLQLVVGVPLEMVHKGLRVGIVYMSGVLAGSLASSIFDPFVYLVGASGGVYALLGGYFSNIIMNWSKMAMNGLHLFFLALIVFADFAFSLYRRFVIYPEGAQQVSFVAHIAGGLAGISIGYVVFSNFNKKLVEDPKFWICLLSYLLCCMVAIFWNIFLSPVNVR